MATVTLPKPPGGFYVYLILIDDQVRYVGKGTGDRFIEHFRMARRIGATRATGKKRRATHFYNRLIECLAGDASIEVQFAAVDLSESGALSLEVDEIAQRQGLWNVYPGGVGFSSEHIKKLWADPAYRAARCRKSRENWEDPAFRANQLAIRNSAAHKERMSAILKAALADPVAKQRMSDAKRRAFDDPSVREETISRLQASRTPAARAKNAIAQKAKWAEPGHREKMRHVHRASRSTAEWRSGQSARATAQQTPEARAKLSATLKAKWADPEFKAAQMARRQSRKA